jgi:hypothetical protein
LLAFWPYEQIPFADFAGSDIQSFKIPYAHFCGPMWFYGCFWNFL